TKYKLNLHSFPTRRSSDLKMNRDVDQDCEKEDEETECNYLRCDPEDFKREPYRKCEDFEESFHGEVLCRFRPKRFLAFLSGRSTDRKSTRLNSSHQIISYA